jgi:DNA mismatch repair protein MutS
VIERARVILDKLEQGEREGDTSQKSFIDDLPLFSATPAQPAPKQSDTLSDKLDDIHPDELTPKDALALLYELKDLSRS